MLNPALTVKIFRFKPQLSDIRRKLSKCFKNAVLSALNINANPKEVSCALVLLQC